MRNKHPGNCLRCSKPVAAGAGYFQRIPGRGWAVRCTNCVGKGNGAVYRAKTEAQS